MLRQQQPMAKMVTISGEDRSVSKAKSTSKYCNTYSLAKHTITQAENS